MIRKKIKTFAVQKLNVDYIQNVFDNKINAWLEENPDIEILDMRTSSTGRIYVLHVLYN